MANLTERVIMDTFSQMLFSMPFDKITVSALTRESGVSHNTFYYHYQDIYALLDAWLEQELGHYLAYGDPDNGYEMIRDLLRACKEKKRMVTHLFNGLSRDHLERYAFAYTDRFFLPYIRTLAAEKSIPEDRLKDIAAFCRYSFLGFFLEYLWNGMSDEEDILAGKIYGMLSEFVRHEITLMENI